MATAAIEPKKTMCDRVIINVHPASIPKMRGLKNRNIDLHKQMFKIKSLEIVPDPGLAKDKVVINDT